MTPTFKTVHVGGRLNVNPEEIIFLQADINYTRVFFTDGKSKIVATNLGKLENRFANEGFFRPNKSYIVNLKHVSRFLHEEQQAQIMMSNDVEIHISRRKVLAFSKRINQRTI
ncbi:MAG: LytR/AlgR family response regulator transcription factor [Spirosomataceae bacterium]